MTAKPVITGDDFVEVADRLDRPRTHDDVCLTVDGQRLDSNEAVLAFLADYNAQRPVTAADAGGT